MNTQELLVTFGPLVLLFLVFYFLMIRPEKRRRQVVMEMQSKIKKDDKIITIGGIHGIIDDINDDSMTIIIASGAKMKIERAAIKHVIDEQKS